MCSNISYIRNYSVSNYFKLYRFTIFWKCCPDITFENDKNQKECSKQIAKWLQPIRLCFEWQFLKTTMLSYPMFRICMAYTWHEAWRLDLPSNEILISKAAAPYELVDMWIFIRNGIRSYVTTAYVFKHGFPFKKITNHKSEENIFNENSKIRGAERLALQTSEHGFSSSNPAGGEILSEPKRCFTAQSPSCSPFHRPDMRKIMLKCPRSSIDFSRKTIPSLKTESND